MSRIGINLGQNGAKLQGTGAEQSRAEQNRGKLELNVERPSQQDISN